MPTRVVMVTNLIYRPTIVICLRINCPEIAGEIINTIHVCVRFVNSNLILCPTYMIPVLHISICEMLQCFNKSSRSMKPYIGIVGPICW